MKQILILNYVQHYFFRISHNNCNTLADPTDVVLVLGTDCSTICRVYLSISDAYKKLFKSMQSFRRSSVTFTLRIKLSIQKIRHCDCCA